MKGKDIEQERHWYFRETDIEFPFNFKTPFSNAMAFPNKFLLNNGTLLTLTWN